MKNYLIAMVILVMAVSCKKSNDTIDYPNNPAEGFDIEGSDPAAIMIADKVMDAMGGRKAWDETHYISWVFFGSRRLTWDKWSGDVRVDYLKEDLNIIVNIHDITGKVSKNGEEMTNPDSLKSYLTKGRNAWINDSYWLVMPFKLKDSGVTLAYLDEDTTQVGAAAHKLELTFKDVGVTPENYYEVWVDAESNLVTQWAFYSDHAQPEPRFTAEWSGYETYGKIKLSGGRGFNSLTEIKVLESVPEATFQSFDPLVL